MTAKNSNSRKRGIIPIDEPANIPRGGCLMRRFPDNKLKIAMFIDRPCIWYEVILTSEPLYTSNDYYDCLNWCEKNGSNKEYK